MVVEGSVSQWLAQLQGGDETALGKIMRRYWPFLVELARKRLRHAPVRSTEEDVAQDAFISFYNSFKNGILPDLSCREHLIALFTTITAKKAASQIKREMAVRRGGGHVVNASALTDTDTSNELPSVLNQLADSARRPDEEAMLADCYHRYVDELPDDLRQLAAMFLAGSTREEMATNLSCSVRKVYRHLNVLLRAWRELAARDADDPGEFV